jgi:molecular chaperone DnaK
VRSETRPTAWFTRRKKPLRFQDKADAAAIEKLQAATDELKEALKGTDTALIKTKLEALTGPLYE